MAIKSIYGNMKKTFLWDLEVYQVHNSLKHNKLLPKLKCFVKIEPLI